MRRNGGRRVVCPDCRHATIYATKVEVTGEMPLRDHGVDLKVAEAVMPLSGICSSCGLEGYIEYGDDGKLHIIKRD